MQALEELERMDSIALNKDQDKTHVKIISLNVCSLRKHISDISHDYDIKSSNVICLQETWLYEDEQYMNLYQFQNRLSNFFPCGRGKGIATYFTSEFEVENIISNPLYQVTKITSPDMDILNVYRSNNASSTFIEDLKDMLTENIDKTTLLCGDLNFCANKHPKHPIKVFLEKLKFVQLIEKPTHIDGGVLDHVYLLCKEPQRVHTKMKGCYYSDHDKNVILFEKH